MQSASESFMPGKGDGLPGTVDRDAVNSFAFHAKFQGLDLPKQTKERAYNEVRRIFRTTDGTCFERLVVIGHRDGRLIVDDFNHPPAEHRAGLTPEENEAIIRYGERVVYIHNHPTNGLLSWVDIQTANRPEVAMNIAACHDGTVYSVSSSYPHLGAVYSTIVAELRTYYPAVRDSSVIEFMAVRQLLSENEKRGGKWLTVTKS